MFFYDFFLKIFDFLETNQSLWPLFTKLSFLWIMTTNTFTLLKFLQSVVQIITFFLQIFSFLNNLIFIHQFSTFKIFICSLFTCLFISSTLNHFGPIKRDQKDCQLLKHTKAQSMSVQQKLIIAQYEEVLTFVFFLAF